MIYTSNMKGSNLALQRFSYEKVFWKYALDLQENTHAEMQFE